MKKLKWRYYRAPQRMFDAFSGDEDAKRIARRDVVAWMRTLMLEEGDVVAAPNPETGLEEHFVKGRMGR